MAIMKSKILVLAALWACASCNNTVGEINDDPNNLSSSTFDNILTGAQVGNILMQSGETARRAGIFAGQFTGIDRQHLGYTRYDVTSADFDPLWYNAYVNAYRNALEAENTLLQGDSRPVSLGITQVMRAYILGTTASLFGDIPFDEAGLVELSDPKFEDQATVYGKVQALLSEAIANLELGSGRPAAGADIYFNGNPQRWIEAAYTLKARYFLHTGEYAQAYAAAQNGISAPEGGMYGPHGTAAEDSNLYYQFFAVQTRQADLVVSDFMASLLKSGADNPIPANYRGNTKTDETARFQYYFSKTNVGIQPNTMNGFAAQSAPSPMVTYEENLLILAEAGLRDQSVAVGLSHLNTLRAYLAQGGYMSNAPAGPLLYEAYTEADFTSGGIENTDGLTTAQALLREILEERYVTLFGQIEPFNDTRRTLSETDVRVDVIPNTGDALPQRFLYPQTEIDRNGNLPSPIPGLFEPTAINR